MEMLWPETSGLESGIQWDRIIGIYPSNLRKIPVLYRLTGRSKSKLIFCQKTPYPSQYCLRWLLRTTLPINSVLALRVSLDTTSVRRGGAAAHLTLVVNWTPVLMTNGRSGCIGMQGCRSTTKALEGTEKVSGSHMMQWAGPCPVPRKSTKLSFKNIGGGGDGGNGQRLYVTFSLSF